MIDLWDNIKTFYLIIKLQSFKKSADYLSIAPSTVSRHIKQLEDILEHSLFDRRNPIIVSTHGKRFFQYIELPCQNLLNIVDFKNETAQQSSYIFRLYVNDLYFFHLLLQIYDCKLVHEAISFNNISINENNKCILHLIENKQNNFVYVTADKLFIQQISKNTDYVCWPIYNIPICHFFSNDFNIRITNFIHYNGTESWLKEIHNDYITANNIPSKDITNSNSIELIFNLIKCSGHSILPGITPYPSSMPGMTLLSKQLGVNKLFCVCHSSDVFLKLIF